MTKIKDLSMGTHLWGNWLNNEGGGDLLVRNKKKPKTTGGKHLYILYEYNGARPVSINQRFVTK